MKLSFLLLQRLFTGIFSFIFSTCYSYNLSAYTVLDLTATCRNGQVFLIWQNAAVTNVQYNIYRSTAQFTSSDQLDSSAYLGFVRDSSSKNMQLSVILSLNIFFRIDSGSVPLPGSQGLYVVTCTSNQPYYYAVTVTTLSGNIQDKSITPGENTLDFPVDEITGDPQPVYQYSERWATGDTTARYVQFVNNQETPWYPAMNSTGSYGFNFYILRRGSTKKYSLFVMYEGLLQSSLKGNGLGEFENRDITNCYILGVADWLPTPKGGTIGEGTNWCGYHENFNIYSNTNPVPTTGTIKLYTQERIIQSIRWSKLHFPIDTSKVYTVGVSAGGNGAMLTALLIPDEIAAVYAIVEPISVGILAPQNVHYQMWGTLTFNLPTDFSNWKTNVPVKIYAVLDHFQLISVNKGRNLPLFFDLHGKGDQTINWNEHIIAWFDSLESNRIGGVFYWDQRSHEAVNANYLDEEITPDFTRYKTTKSFPAFSYCSINQDPGDGTAASGDLYGALNGYLEWKDNVKDKACDYTVNVLLKDFYVGGIPYAGSPTTCTTDITFRRLQNFHPETGATITWKNTNPENVKIQSGSLIYDGEQITIKSIIVNKNGNKIKLKITDCAQRLDADDDVNTGNFVAAEEMQPSLKCYPNPSNGMFTIALKLNYTETTPADIEIINSLSQIVYRGHALITNGKLEKEMDVASFLRDEIYVVKMIAGDTVYSGKMIIKR